MARGDLQAARVPLLPAAPHLAVEPRRGVWRDSGRWRSQRWCSSPAASTPPRRSPSPAPRASSATRCPFDYGQRHRSSSRRRGASPRALGAARAPRAPPRPARHRRLGAHRRHRGPQGPSAAASAPGIPVTYVPARNTIFLAMRSPGPRCSARRTSSSASTRSTTSGYPDCRPEFIDAFERLANLATKAGVEGTSRFRDPRAADRADQGPDHPPRHGARRRLRASPTPATTPRPTGAPAATATPACCAGRDSRKLASAIPCPPRARTPVSEPPPRPS